jgi:formate hydrogenlyase subunit 4
MIAFTLASAAHVAVLMLGPILLVGVINRTKSIWVGRRGVPLLQLAYDLAKLLKKRPVYSATTTAIFRVTPQVALGTALLTGLVVPLVAARAPLSFPFDFVLVAYGWGLGRLFLMLGALDTGSAFEGMGASREAKYSALVEPAFFLAFGALAAVTGARSLAELLRFPVHTPADLLALVGVVAALFVLLQVESARLPVDDPATHLELTMIHEVMVLDHSGPDLAAIQYAAALKLLLGAGLLATLVNPVDPGSAPGLFGAMTLALILAIGIVIGTVESLMARLKLRVLPRYALGAIVAAAFALLANAWSTGSLR